jgi:hypothetical protein
MTLTFIELRTLVAADEIDISFTPAGYRPIPIMLADLDILLDEGLYEPMDEVELDFGEDGGSDCQTQHDHGYGGIVAAKAILA